MEHLCDQLANCDNFLRIHRSYLVNLDHIKSIVPKAITMDSLAELPVPIIASGGAGTVDHIADVLTLGRADAALAASIFHYNEIPIPVLKRELKKRNINVRL